MARDIKKIDFVEERSHQAREVLGKAPNWVIRWGTGIISLVIIGLVILAWIIKYPDIINGRITVTTPIPPSNVISRSDGRIVQLFVNDNQLVKQNELLALIENPANIDEMFWLKRQLKKINTANPKTLLIPDSIINNSKLNLGECQVAYAEFFKRYQEYQVYDQLQAVRKEQELINIQVQEYEELKKQQSAHMSIHEEEITLVNKAKERAQQLFDEGAAAKEGIEQREMEILGVRKNYENTKTTIAQTTIDISNLKKKLLELDIQKEESQKRLYINLMESYKKLSATIDSWEQKYLIKSPINGQVSFFNVWSNDQFVRVGQEVMTIVPETEQQLIGKVIVPIQNSGKLKATQKVNIALDGYPYQEYGMIIGKVKTISLVPKNNVYAIEVELHNNLNTTYGKTIDFKQELQGNVEIITEDIRFLERVFYQFKKLMK